MRSLLEPVFFIVLTTACGEASASPKQAPHASTTDAGSQTDTTRDAAMPRANGPLAPQTAPTRTTPCPDGMILIQPATFTAGRSADDPNDALHKVTLTKAYCIDRVPVTVAQYRKCVEASACSEPTVRLDCTYCKADRDNYPVNAVTWLQADGYCKWAGQRLPSDAEWELAARGTDGRKFPWGNQPADDSRLYFSKKIDRYGPGPVGMYPKGASPFGVLDMAGNVSQWVADWDAKHPKTAVVDPIGPTSGEQRILRGVAYDAGKYPLGTIGERYVRRPQLTSPTTGFRCGADVSLIPR